MSDQLQSGERLAAASSANAAAAYTINGQLCPREAFYAVACDPQRSVVVEACAGAGKTWMLVSRILRALLDGAQPQQVVAITFTRKAAGEMRQRLSEWLHEFAQASEAECADALVQRGMSASEAQQAAPRLRELQQSLLLNARSVEIRTFHAWFSQLLRAAPLELLQAEGISPELQLLEDEADLLPDLWRRFHQQVLADTELREDYQALVDACGRSTVQRWLEAGFAKRVELRLAHQHGVLLSSVGGPEEVSPRFVPGQEVLALFVDLVPALSDLAKQLGSGKNKTMQGAGVAIEAALTAHAQGGLSLSAAYAQVRKALLTESGTLRKALGDSPELQWVADEMALLARGLSQAQAQALHGRLCRLSLCLIEQFEHIKAERGLVDMNDLERGALALLSDAPVAGWVQERLDAQVRHLLIDEFQDTSPLQWQALYAWLSSYSGAGGGGSGQRPPSVFIVGDPKQSIYRFRRAEPRVFNAARDFVREALDGFVLACDHTRRNAPEVLDGVNKVFDLAALLDNYQGFRPHTTEVGQPDALAGVVRLDEPPVDPGEASAIDAEPDTLWRPSLTQARHEPELHRRADEAERVAQAISSLLSQGQVLPGEIYVLARKREPLRVLAQSLKSRGIAHAAPEDSALLDAPDVRDMLALLDFLVSPAHDLSLAQVLRSPLFGVNESALVLLAERAGTARWTDVAGTPRSASCSWWAAFLALPEAELAPELCRARVQLSAWLREVHRRTPHELLDLILHQGDVLARVAAVAPPTERRSRLHALQSLLGLALDLDGGRYASAYAFVRALRQRALSLSAPSSLDAVQLLTVHGAKGLEARVVFLMDTDAASARAESATLLIDWPVQQAWPSCVAFVSSESKPPPALSEVMDFEQSQRRREELNALYVAMTRAKTRLVFSRTQSKRGGGEGSWWARLFDHAQPWCLAGDVTVDASERVGSRLLGSPATVSLPELPTLPPSEGEPWQTEVEPAGLVVRTPELDESAALGEAMHRVLEWVGGPGGEGRELDHWMAAAAQMYGLDSRRTERLQQCVKAILASPQCQPFFDKAQLQWSGNEVPVHWGAQELRIDRLVLREEAGGQAHWWVLDFKLHGQPQSKPEYLEQVRRYREAVQNLQPGEPVRTAFITGEGRLIEVS